MTRVLRTGQLLIALLIVFCSILFGLTDTDAQQTNDSALKRHQTAIALYRESVTFYQEKKYDDFIRSSLKALELMPKSKRLRFQLARGYALTGQPEEALKRLKEVVDAGLFLEETLNEKDLQDLHSLPAFKNLRQQISLRLKPIIHSQTAFSLPERDLVPEGSAYDPVEKFFYFSSLSKCKIIRIDEEGNASDFILSGQDGFLPGLGLHVDAQRRVLWACNGLGYANARVEKERMGTSGIFKYDLNSKGLIKKYLLPQAENHFLNDVALTPEGTVYISDSHVPAVYKIAAGSDILELFAPLDDYLYPNGITYSNKSAKIFVTSSADIAVVDAETGKVRALDHPPDMYISGNDGLYYYDGSLIGVQNYSRPARIIRIVLDQKEERAVRLDILEFNNPLIEIPATGVVVADWFYFMANTQLEKFDNDGRLPPLEALKETKVLKLKLGRRRME